MSPETTVFSFFKRAGNSDHTAERTGLCGFGLLGLTEALKNQPLPIRCKHFYDAGPSRGFPTRDAARGSHPPAC